MSADHDTYIPNARDAVIAYACASRAKRGYHTCKCVRCHDTDPWPESERVYGERPGDRSDTSDESCVSCGVTLRSLSERCQAEHDAQQARWARGLVHYLDELGAQVTCRWRVY